MFVDLLLFKIRERKILFMSGGRDSNSFFRSKGERDWISPYPSSLILMGHILEMMRGR